MEVSPDDSEEEEHMSNFRKVSGMKASSSGGVWKGRVRGVPPNLYFGFGTARA